MTSANNENPLSPASIAPARAIRRWLDIWLSDRMLSWGIAGFLAGYLVMWNVELQLMWLTVVCLPAGVACCCRTRGAGMAREPMLRLAAAFLVWNLAVGLIRNPGALANYYTIEFIAGAVLLPVFLGGVWLVCRRMGAARRLTLVLAWSGIAAAAAGLIYWWLVQIVDEPGARLRNPLVHGGQHPVGTAINLGFALVAAAAVFGGAQTRRARIIWLAVIAVQCLALMLTLSRGVLLALGCVPIALFLMVCISLVLDLRRGLSLRASLQTLARGWPKVWPPLITTATVMVVFLQFIAPLLAPPAVMQQPAVGEAPVEVIVLSTLSSNPAREYIARSDSGRFHFYRVGLSCLSSWDKVITGAGLWEPERIIERESASVMNHMHSMFLATYIHGGIIGSVMLVGLIGLGLKKSWWLARAGQPQWLAFLAYGLGGLIFDGQSACSLVTHPRFENLIFWFPLIAIAALWQNGQDAQAGRQPSSSESR